MSLQPKSNIPRPALPPTRNPHLVSIEEEGVQPVKYQIITRDNQEIIVGRIKIPTVENHAFILRRFDTGAISLSTMFRSAFAGITDEQEKVETTWIKASYDTAGANGGGKMRLAGTWIPVALAVQIAPEYRLENIIQPLVTAVPGPKEDYRKSRPAPSLPAPAGSPAPARGNASGTLAPTTPSAKRARKSQSPSPAVAKPVGRSTPARLRAPAIVEEEEAAAKSTTIDVDKDIAEAKADVAAIKAKLKGNAKGHKQVEVVVPSTPSRKKRVIEETEDAPPKLNLERIKEIQENVQNGVVEERPVIPLPKGRGLNPANKAAAFGTLAFFAGVAVVTYLPQVAQSFF